MGGMASALFVGYGLCSRPRKKNEEHYKMRQTVSFSLKEETMSKLLERLLESNSYRNKSHLVECALEKYLEENRKEEQK